MKIKKKKHFFLVFVLCMTLALGNFSMVYGLESSDSSGEDPKTSETAVTESTTKGATEEVDTSILSVPEPKNKKIQALAFDGAEMSFDNTVIEFSSQKTYNATVTLPALDIANPDGFAKGLNWFMTRDADDSPFRANDKLKSLFKNVYTGDNLENIKMWAASGDTNKDMFDINVTGKAVDIGGVTGVAIDVAISNKVLFGTGEANQWNGGTTTDRRYRAAQQSFYGDYDLKLVSGTAITSEVTDENTLASEEVKFTPYKSYRTYMEVYRELVKLQDELNGTDYELDIETIGTSTDGWPIYTAVFGKKGMADKWLDLTNTGEVNPNKVSKDIKNGKYQGGEYAIPMFLNNVHPDEAPGSDAILDILYSLINEDEMDLKEITDYQSPDKEYKDGYTTPMIKDWSTNLGRNDINIPQQNEDVNDLYKTETNKVDVSYLLDNVFFIMCPNENPDGRISNGRRNGNGFDLNRDGSYQIQNETRALEPTIAKWNPIVMDEFHGYVQEFLIEPCTPPHEQNLEYDLTIEDFYKMAEVFGNNALGTMGEKYEAGSSVDPSLHQYAIPLRDYFLEDGWDAWDDLSTSYGPSYAMINCGAMGYTIEIPWNNQISVDALHAGTFAQVEYMADNKDKLVKKQLEFFRRGIENIDVTTAPLENNDLEQKYVNAMDEILPDDGWRPKYDGVGENGKYFPEYYVIPTDSVSQRDIGDVALMEEYFDRNDIQMKKLNKDVTINGKTYKSGALVIDMHQGKRNYANAVLWQGLDTGKFFSALYSESVVSFPYLRGFDCIPISVVNAIPKSSLETIDGTGNFSGTLDIANSAYKAVIIKNSGTEAVKAINDALNNSFDVGMIDSGKYKGNFIVSKIDYQWLANKYILSGIGVEKAGGDVYKISKPKLFIPGQLEKYEYIPTNTNDYYKDWFADGAGAANASLVHGSYENAYFDIVSYRDEMNFDITGDPSEADIIIGSQSVNSGFNNAQAVNAIKDGTPYISTGLSPLSYLRSNIAGEDLFNFDSHRLETLHYVDFVGSNNITATKVSNGDNVVYNYGAAYITSLSKDAKVLFKAKTMQEGFHFSGCFADASNQNLGGKVEAFTYTGPSKVSGVGNIDITVFATSLTRKVHQQDDTLFATNAIYDKMKSKQKWDTFSGIDSKDKADINKATVSKIGNTAYNGKAKTPSVKVSLNGKALKANTDYRVTYSNNVKVGNAKVTITGLGNYKGTKAVTFKIVPKKASIKKVVASKKKTTIKWKKIAGTTKYQVRYKAKAAKKWKVKNVSAKKSSYVVKKLKKGKKYQFQVRSYKTVNKAKYYGAWSKKVTKKIK